MCDYSIAIYSIGRMLSFQLMPIQERRMRCPGNGEDAGPQLRAHLEDLPDGACLRLDPGVYTLYAEGCPEYDLCLCNNRSGRKPVAVPLCGRNDVTIDGSGAHFVVHGGLVPFWLADCCGVHLKGFSIDWARPFYSQAEITDFDEDGVEFELDAVRYPCHMEGDRLIFDGEGWSSPLAQGIFEIDAASLAPARGSGDNLGTNVIASDLPFRSLGANRYRIEQSFRHPAKPGNLLVLRHFLRHYPGIFIERCRDISLQEINVYHSSGTGLLAQFTDNILLDHVSVRPAPASGRVFSASVDAAHFVNCRGLVHQRGCHFERMLDDPTNVHGTNYRLAAPPEGRSARFERVHLEQHGFEPGFPGDRVQFSSREDLLPVGEGLIESVEDLDGRFCRVVFAGPLPKAPELGMVMENLSWTPDVRIEEGSYGPNRARGLLLSTPGRIRVERNRITAAGAAIKISGDANYWFESGAVRDVLIRDNVFTDCCYGPPEWGTAVIDIDPEIADPWSASGAFHRNIRIVDNSFRTFDPATLYARSVDGLEFARNRIEISTTHPPHGRLPSVLNFDACTGLRVEDNQVDPAIIVPFETRNEAPPGCPRWTPQTSLDQKEEDKQPLLAREMNWRI